MIRHYFIIACQQLEKYKLQTLLSLVGLAIGFTCFALSSLWWKYETTYDSFHPEADNLYLQMTSTDNWVTANYSTLYTDASLAMESIPQVEQATTSRISISTVNDTSRVITRLVDSLFLPVFQPELVAGAYPLMRPDGTNVVLTDKAALKLFGTTDCIGRKLKLKDLSLSFETDETAEKRDYYTIAAVIKDWGKHSFFTIELPFDCLMPFKAEEVDLHSRTMTYAFETILKLHPTANIDTVTSLINKLQPSEEGVSKRIVKLSSLRTEYNNMFSALIKIEHIRTFAILGLLVVVCAIFNYLSLYIVRIRMRAREMALRIAFGSSRRQLFALLITEFLILLFVSCILGILFISLTLPEFKDITYIKEKDTFFYTEMGLYMLTVSLATIPLLLGVTWWMQRQTLNGVLQKGAITVRRNLFRPLSQWVQLAISMGLVFSTSVIILQIHHLRHTTATGFIHENRAIFCSWNNPEQMEEIAHYLRHHPNVEQVVANSNHIGESNAYCRVLKEDGNTILVHLQHVNHEEIGLWGLELLEGRWMEDYEQDVVMLNESAVKFLNLNNPVDTILPTYTKGLRIVGVVRNVNHQSLITPQEPMIYMSKGTKKGSSSSDRNFVFSYTPGTWPALRDSIHSRYYEGNNVYWNLRNVEQEFNNLLHSEDKLLGLFYIITGVCILIALFGVYSLITISCEQRRKEIAVRKVFGAKAKDILQLFFREQLIILLLSAIVSFPIAYVCIKPWLEGYIHQVKIPLWLCPVIFVSFTLLVALCVGWRVWKTAKAHPADEIAKGRG